VLHLLAADLDDRGERELVGRLLAAKSTVEAQLLRPATPLAASVDALREVTLEALRRVGIGVDTVTTRC
jgi:hypothetical protein